MPNQFPIITDGTQGDVPINYYPAQDSVYGMILERDPGLDGFSTLTNCTELRGLYAYGDNLYAVARRGSASPVCRINTAGAATEIGEINTSYTGRVTFAENPTQLGICDGATIWVYTPASGSLAKVTDGNFVSAGGITAQDGYGIHFRVDSTAWAFSDTNDLTAYDALDYYSQRAKNDYIRGILSHLHQLWLVGDKAYEVWYNAGGDNTSADNPTFALYKDGIYDVGIGAPETLNNMEGAGPCWVSNRQDLIITQGISPVAVPNQMFSRELAGYDTIEDANAFSYVLNGHTFVQINFPTADKTWVFDATTKMFHKKQSRKSDQTFGRHRGNCYAHFNGKHYVGDYTNGKIYEMSPDFYDDDSDPIRRELYTANINNGMRDMKHAPMQLLCDAGIGLSGADAPQIMLQYSNDGGHTWSNEVWRDMGKIGEYYRKAVWSRLGASSQRMYRFAMTDAVAWRVLGIDAGGGK